MKTSAAKHLRQVSMLSGEVLATESYHYPDEGSAVIQLGEEELVMPVPEFAATMRRARALGKLPLKYWRGQDGTEILGIGRAIHTIPYAGFGTISDVLRRGYKEALEHHYNTSDLPCVFLSMHFDPEAEPDTRWRLFPAVSFTIPAIVLKEQGGRKTVYFTGTRMAIPGLRKLWTELTTSPSSVPEEQHNTLDLQWDDAAYRNLVQDGLANIDADVFSKVVLARECRIAGTRLFDPVAVVERLRAQYADCFQYCDMPSATTAFVSASPERLARVMGGAIHTAALAGTAVDGSRESGQLLQDRKNRSEHAYVVDMIRGTLEQLCSRVSIDPSPEEIRLPNVTHLKTAVYGTMKNGFGLLDAIAALHPTPAVCGTPCTEAMGFIREYEGGFRGMYAGVAGWLDAHNQGEAAVMIRSGLIQGSEASVFAGAGIVIGSDPESETAETRFKAQALIDALQEA